MGEASDAPVVGLGAAGESQRRLTGWRRWYAGSLVGLSFLVVTMVQAATTGGSVPSVIAFELLAALFAITYIFAPVVVGNGFDREDSRKPRKLAALAVMVGITVPMIMIGGAGIASLWIYVAVVGAMMVPLRWALAIAVVLATAMLVISGQTGVPLPWELALTLLALTLWMAGFADKIRLTIELRETRDELARAAVAAERARIGRDLHDILGHSLTAIAVKAGLARRLIDRDVVAATAEIKDVERLAREALTDVRATAAGYRSVSLAGELAVARSVLRAADIQATLPTAVDDVLPAGREVFGYVVREAVTNIVRHSGAQHCTIELTRDSVQITDDGVHGGDLVNPHAAGPGSGRGLDGLAQRVEAAHGSLDAGPRSGGGFQVRATLREARNGPPDAPGVSTNTSSSTKVRTP